MIVLEIRVGVDEAVEDVEGDADDEGGNDDEDGEGLDDLERWGERRPCRRWSCESAR